MKNDGAVKLGIYVDSEGEELFVWVRNNRLWCKTLNGVVERCVNKQEWEELLASKGYKWKRRFSLVRDSSAPQGRRLEN